MPSKGKRGKGPRTKRKADELRVKKAREAELDRRITNQKTKGE